MNQAKMTPGPWRWTAGEQDIDIDTYKSPGYYNNPELTGANGEHVIGCGEYSVVGNEADARAIACLPELIEAARHARTALLEGGQLLRETAARDLRLILARIDGTKLED